MTKAIVRKAAAVMMASVLTLGLAGCALRAPEQQAGPAPASSVAEQEAAQVEALDAYIESERRMIPTIMDATGDTYSEITIDPEYPSTVVFTYTYAAYVDPAEGSAYFDTMIPTLQDACDSAVFPAMKRTGVEGTPYAVYTYLNPDGSTIWTYRFSS